MYCKYCGNQMDDRAIICPHCGIPTDKFNQTDGTAKSAPPAPSANSNSSDSGSIGFGVLSFMFPVVGFILYLVWVDVMPLKAKSCGKGAITGLVIWFAAAMIYLTIFIVIYSNTYYDLPLLR